MIYQKDSIECLANFFDIDIKFDYWLYSIVCCVNNKLLKNCVKKYLNDNADKI